MKILLYVTFEFLCIGLTAQVNFNEYNSMTSNGVTPKDFIEETFQKINQEHLSGRSEIGNQFDQREFLIQSRYSIDDLLHSGTVIYGDEISNFVTKVANKIMESRSDLKAKLRFYTVKSNTANAFSTDQGIIFVTTGLISRLENEAQLAYILAHEISHFTEMHVVNTFIWQKKEEYNNNWLRQMSIYSQDKELDADRLAVTLYMKAGYAKEELNSVFDILKYSHLPFGRKIIGLDYFETSKMILDPTFVSDSIYIIQTHESETDTLGSHPNTSKRKQEVENEISKLTNEWGIINNFYGQDQFNYIRNLARFESIRIAVLNAEYVESIYSIYLMEEEFPNSIFLKQMKAQSWLGLYRYNKSGQILEQLIPETFYEGEIAVVYQLVKNNERKELTTIALRTIYDLHQSNKNDDQISAIYSCLLSDLRIDSKFKLTDYYPKTITEIQDSMKITPSDYYIYSISDIMQDTQFISDLNTKDKQKEVLNQNSIDKLISVEPRVISYTKEGLDLIRSEQLEHIFSDAIELGTSKAHIEVQQINSRLFIESDTTSFNERSLIYSYLTQLSNNEAIHPFPVDYSQLHELKKKYGTSKIMFNVVMHTFDPDINWWIIAGSAWLVPTFPAVVSIYIPERIISGNNTDMLMLIVDIETGEEILNVTKHYNESLTKYGMGARMYDLFMSIKPTQNN